MRHRLLRLSFGGLVVVAAGVTLAPHATSYVATSAVVNAPIIPVKAPFDSLIIQASQRRATPLTGDESVVRLRADRADRTRLVDLRAQRKATRGQISAIETHIARLHGMREDLQARRDHQESILEDWVNARQREAAAEAESARIRAEYLTSSMTRAERLSNTGAMAETAFDEAAAEAAEARMTVARSEARADMLDIESRGIAENIVFDNGSDSMRQIIERLDEIRIRLADLNQRRSDLKAQLHAVNDQIDELQRHADRLEEFSPTTTSAGVVWKASPPDDMPVLAGDPIVQVLDCTRRFLEVAIPERHFEQIRPGDTAHVRFKGGSGWFTATVDAVRGAGSRLDRPELAAAPPRTETDQLNVMVGLGPVDVRQDGVAASFCDVGRTADVRFDKHPGALHNRLSAMWTGVVDRSEAVQDWFAARADPAG